MQLEKARMLREIWTARGSPACEYPVVDRVYNLAADTGGEGLYDVWQDGPPWLTAGLSQSTMSGQGVNQ